MENFEDLVRLFEEGEIGWCDMAMRSEHRDEFVKWCAEHGEKPNDDNAQLYLEQTEERIYEQIADLD